MSNPLSAFNRSVSYRWHLLIGKPSEFSLEARIFHSISLGIAILTAIYLPYDVYAGLYVAGGSCALVAGFFSYEYYRSRFSGKQHRTLPFGLFGLIVLSFNYFANAGILGSTDLIWPVYLLMVLTICPLRQQLPWVITYIIVFGLVHVAEHQYPQWVSYPFQAGKGQFTDRITAFPIPVISMAIIIGLFRRSYERERANVAQRDAEKTRLLSILSHDLRAPFTQVKQYLELLEDHTLSAADRLRLEGILRQANDQTLDLVTNLLYWSRSQLEGATMHLARLNLAQSLNTTLAITTALATQKGIDVQQQIDAEIIVVGDADMLQLVVRNLLQNAIKFTPSKGTIKVDTTIINNHCRLMVSDTGTGIPSEKIETLFAGAATPTYGTANEKGVGLGLQLCHEFMERQHGSIYVESELGKGSKFSIELPLK